jgi:hypothetical protein
MFTWSTEDSMSVQAEQYAEFKRGGIFGHANGKPLCVIEERKCATTFARVIADAATVEYHVHVHTLPEGREVAVAWTPDVINEYLGILHAADWPGNRQAYQVRLGVLFGYPREECETFAAEWSPDYCQCSKCVGIADSNPSIK